MGEREINMGSFGGNPEQAGERKKLLQEIDRLTKETPKTSETIGALVVLNSLAGAMHMNEEKKLANLTEKYSKEALTRINREENWQN